MMAAGKTDTDYFKQLSQGERGRSIRELQVSLEQMLVCPRPDNVVHIKRAPAVADALRTCSRAPLWRDAG
jgi:hypothetical protein